MRETSTATLSEGIDARIERMIGDIHHCTVGRVESYNRGTQRCNVQPLIRRGFINEVDDRQVERLPVIPNVPIAFPGAFHPEPGDIVLLVFCDFSTERWKNGPGTEVDPGDDRRHAITDAFAIPLVSTRPRLPNSLGQLVIGRDGSPPIEFDRTQIRVGGAGGQRTLLADSFLQALDAMFTAIATAVGSAGSPPGAATGQAAIEAASEVFRAAMLTYVTLITTVR